MPASNITYHKAILFRIVPKLGISWWRGCGLVLMLIGSATWLRGCISVLSGAASAAASVAVGTVVGG